MARQLGSFIVGSWSPPQYLTGELNTSIARKLALLSVDFPRAPSLASLGFFDGR